MQSQPRRESELCTVSSLEVIRDLSHLPSDGGNCCIDPLLRARGGVQGELLTGEINPNVTVVNRYALQDLRERIRLDGCHGRFGLDEDRGPYGGDSEVKWPRLRWDLGNQAVGSPLVRPG